MDEFEERLIDQSKEDDDTRKVTLWLLEERPKAYLFSEGPPSAPGRKFWLPRSQITHVSRDASEPGVSPRCTVTVKEWLLEARGL